MTKLDFVVLSGVGTFGSKVLSRNLREFSLFHLCLTYFFFFFFSYSLLTLICFFVSTASLA